MARKKINYELIPTKTAEPWELLRVAHKWHPELDEAQIALAWRKALKPDKDGHLILGSCVKVSDLNKELKPFDFIILLNQEVWQDPQFTREKKLALLDHELCHAAPVFDAEGHQKEDERSRRVWRTRKHDIEEFKAIVARHGCYKRDLELFAEALLKGRRQPLFATDSAEGPEPKRTEPPKEPWRAPEPEAPPA